MSTDYYAHCDVHKAYWYIGFETGARFSFGFGKNDDEARVRIGLLFVEHADCRPWVGRMAHTPGGYQELDVSGKDGPTSPPPASDSSP